MPTLNAGRYASVVAEYDYAPKMIDSERDYRQCRRTLERLLFPDRKLPAEEDALAKLLTHLIGVYEDSTVVPPRTTPRQVLKHLMEQRELKQADLVKLFGTPSIVSEVLSGRRPLSLAMIRNLVAGLGLPAAVLLQETTIGVAEKRSRV